MHTPPSATTDDKSLRALILEALSNARENGTDLDQMTNEELAEDLMVCDADIERYTVKHGLTMGDVAQAVKVFRHER